MSIKPVIAVSRALKILEVFSLESPQLGLSAIARVMALPKTTVLRLLHTLQDQAYVTQTEDGAWRLGPVTVALGERYQMAFDMHENVEPALRALSDTTGHDTSFFVHDGGKRIRLMRVRYPGASHSVARVGDLMPLDRGSPGKVIMAALGHAGELYDEIRARGYHITIGEAKQASASIAAAVFGNRWRVVGALCIGAPATPQVQAELSAYAPELMRTALTLSATLGNPINRDTTPLPQAMWSWPLTATILASD